MKLREYQKELLDKTRDKLRRGVRSLLTVAPTGAGKTILFAEIARGAASKNNRVLILVHRREIMEQTLSKLFSFGIVSGQIASGKPMTNDYVQTAMVHTLRNRLHYVKRPDLIIIDECHHALMDNSWGRIMKYWKEVPKLGYTATPERLDGRGLGESFEDMVEGPTVNELVSDGWLSYPAVYRPPEEIIGKYHMKRGDFDRSEQSETMSRRKIVGDVIDHYRRHMEGLPAVCFCVSVEHSKLMAEQFRREGYNAAAVWGNMRREFRDRAIQGLADGSVQIVTSCDVISEGVDIPVMAGAILLRRTMSLAIYLQQVGRALRSYPGKRNAVILDHVGNYQLHGHVLTDRVWSLDSEKRDPRKEAPPETRTCPRCYGVWPGRPRQCPECGYRWTEAPDPNIKDFKIIEGELVEAGVDPGDAPSMAAFIARTQRMDPKKRQQALWGKAYELAGHGDEGKRKLDSLRAAVGYKPGWTSFVWKEILKRRA